MEPSKYRHRTNSLRFSRKVFHRQAIHGACLGEAPAPDRGIRDKRDRVSRISRVSRAHRADALGLGLGLGLGLVAPRLVTSCLVLSLCLLASVGLVSGSAAASDDKDPAPGTRITVRAAEMPVPYSSDSVANSARHVRWSTPLPMRLPPGFRASVYASGFDHARWLAVAPNGDVMLAEPRRGWITLLQDRDGDGRADRKDRFATGFDRPHGLAFGDGVLYVADTEHVWRLPYQAGDRQASGSAVPLTRPGALGEGSGHWTRNIALHPDGKRMYVAIGSRGNISVEPNPRATVQELDLARGTLRPFASGLRNPVGIAFRPGSTDLYVVVNERDGLGDRLVPDYLTRIRKGAFYGWPYAYLGGEPQPDFADLRPDLVARTRMPDLLFRSHSAPLGLVFYDGQHFPDSMHGDAFVALHGSWNASTPRGYMIVRVPFEGEQPASYYEVFASGFRVDDGGRGPARVWGRPVGLALAQDGALLVADDAANAIWRIAYEGKD